MKCVDGFTVLDLEEARAFQRKLAVLSEGFCPEHLVPLGARSWCPSCAEFWTFFGTSTGDQVIAHSPSPFRRLHAREL